MDAHPRHVLLVEDDPDIRESLAEVLADEGYRISTAGDGAEALECLHTVAPLPDLIVLDLMMPGMSGYDFRAIQRGDPTLARIPVVVLSGDGEVVRKTRDLAVAGALAKPVTVSRLLATLDALAAA